MCVRPHCIGFPQYDISRNLFRDWNTEVVTVILLLRRGRFGDLSLRSKFPSCAGTGNSVWKKDDWVGGSMIGPNTNLDLKALIYTPSFLPFGYRGLQHSEYQLPSTDLGGRHNGEFWSLEDFGNAFIRL